MEFKFINLNDTDLDFTFNEIEFAKKLKYFILENNYYIPNRFLTGYENLKNLRANFLLSNTRLSDTDIFKHNILLDVLEKFPSNPVNKTYYDFDEEQLESYVIKLLINADYLLSGMYDFGETQLFTGYDGLINKEYLIKEDANLLSVYAYYSYIGK